jgi:(1->4)-alpha-D-glucan 1-alpha-D-glucosylmutase
MVFHALVAAHPLPLHRAWPVIEKSAREAGVRTSWTRAHAGFEAALRRLVEHALSDPACTVVVDDLVAGGSPAADVAALAQLALQLLAPGIPDLYQGGEAWDRSLVDPDNRRPLDPAHRRALLARADAIDAVSAWSEPDHRAAGTPRLLLLRAALGLRHRQRAAVGPGPAGAYVPIQAAGPDRERVLAFGRGDRVAVVAARPGPGGRIEADAQVALPDGPWLDVLTGARHDGPTSFADLTALFPVAVLERAAP